MEEAERVLQEAFLATLQQTLKLPADGALTLDTPVVSLGVDSLVAVDMRAWFASELDLDMPVLKLLGGATVVELVEDAAARMSRDLVPKVAQVEEYLADEEQPGPQHRDGANLENSGDPIAVEGDKEAAETTGKEKEEKVTKRELERAVPMAYASTRFWFLQQYLDDPTPFNLVFRARITGPLRIPDLKLAVDAVTARHEAFRTSFFLDGDTPMQGVMPKSVLELKTASILGDHEVADACRELASHRYNIERGETARLVLLSPGHTVHYLLFGFHHIAIDGFSFNVFLAELDRAYRSQPLLPVTVQFSDFAVRQRRAVESGQLRSHLDFWKREYPDCPPPLPLFPLSRGRTRRPLTRYTCADASVLLDASLTARIKQQARHHRATAFHFFLATLKVFLFRWLDTDDISIGLVDANRTDSDTAGTIGCLLNLLPLRVRRWHADSSFTDVLAEARDKTYAALAHSALPFDVLLEELAITRSSTHSPLFQVFFDYRQLAVRTEKVLNADLDGDASLGNTAYDISLDITDIAGGGITVAVKTQKYLYPQRAAELLLRSYLRMLDLFSARPDALTSEPTLFDDAAVREALDAGRGRAIGSSSAWPPTASHRIDQVAARHPERISIRDGHGTILTYSAMATRCDAICTALDAHGIAEGAAVAVLQEPTAWWACSLLGVWRAGCAYVPLDTCNTARRLAAVMNDCGAGAILCDNSTAARAAALNTPGMTVINVDTFSKASDQALRPACRARPEAPAAILYTSGSTGTPKGVVLRHAGLRNNIEGSTERWGIGREIVLQQSACTFDLSLRQLLTALTGGGTLFVAPAEVRRDPVRLCSLLATEAITWTLATPSEYQAWLTHAPSIAARAASWRFAFSGGEVFTHVLRDHFVGLANPLLRVFNLYGPSEITISCAEAEIPCTLATVPADRNGEYDNDDDASIPLGRPLPNYSIRIVDERFCSLPLGVAGEIVVSGPGVAAGYVDTALNAARFITGPDDVVTTSFRTGDVGHLERDGTLFFHGRVSDDSQIKLRGIRIELGDVERAILEAGGNTLAAAVVSMRGNPPFLAAHIEFVASAKDDNAAAAVTSLKSRLVHDLPQYMCPATLIPVDRVPLTAHGKLDRHAAAALPLSVSGIGPDSSLELTADQRALERLWRAVVSHEAPPVVDANTSFFDVGGNSLLLVNLSQLIRKELGVVVPLRQLLEANTLAAMAAAVAHGVHAHSSVDWARDDIIAAEPLDPPNNTLGQAPPFRDPARLCVLLTGATGYLGRRILQQLIADERVAEVHCIAVRQATSTALITAGEDIAKVVVHLGDLAKPQLGLSDKIFMHLASSADAIIHSGADRSFWDAYEHLRGPNVMSTRELIRLAAPRRIPLHFVSSAGVLPLLSSSSLPTQSTDAGSGYVVSKWASERLLADAATRFGLPVRIHRAMPVISKREGGEDGEAGEKHGVVGAGVAPPAELLRELRHMAAQLHALPATSKETAGTWTGHFDLIKVDPLARELCGAVVDDSGDDGRVVQYRYPSTARLSMHDIAQLVEVEEQEADATVTPWPRLPPHEWAGKAKGLGFSWHFAVLDASISLPTNSTHVGADDNGLVVRR